MWPDRRVTDLLGIDHPIIQAPMAGVATPRLVAAVSNAGGLGSFGAAGVQGEALHRLLGSIRALTDAPFNINLFNDAAWHFDPACTPGPALRALLERYHQALGLGAIPAPTDPFGCTRDQLEILLAQEVAVISFHFGVDAHTVRTAHRAGARVLCTATTVDEARTLEAAGVDAIIAQGAEAGGHRGSFATDYRQALIGTLALVPQVVDAVSVPVIAAGGIMDGRGIVACLALGAAAVQLGTAFMACPETALSPPWLAALESAGAGDTRVTAGISGKPARAIRNRWVRDLEALGEGTLPFPAQYSLSRTLRPAAAAAGRDDCMALWAGQGLGLLPREGAASLVARLVAESTELRGRLSASATAP